MKVANLVLTKALLDYLRAKGWLAAGTSPNVEQVEAIIGPRLDSGELTFAVLEGLMQSPEQRSVQTVKAIVEQTVEALGGRNGNGRKGPTPGQVFGGGGSTGTVKRPSERYGTQKAKGLHVVTKQPVVHPMTGHEAELLSGSEKALAGAYWKWVARKQGLQVTWTDHDAELFQELVNDWPWTGEANGEYWEHLPGGERVKALLDESVSGGINLVPVVIDSDIVTALLLGSEIYPFVDLKDLPSGRRIEVPVMGTPTVTWGIPEGTSIPLFDTTGLLTTIPATVQTVTAAVEVGRDLLADASINVGTALEEAIGQRFTSELDQVVVLGDGVVQPLGIFNTPGLATVASASGATGPVTIGDLEGLMFGLQKQYRTPNLGPCFIGNDTAYRRFRAIPTAATWNTRAMGEDYGSYNVMGWPFRINNAIPNGKVAAVALKRYRLWRRTGFEPRWVTEGKELALKNQNLLVVRGRYAGKLVDAAAAVLTVDLQA